MTTLSDQDLNTDSVCPTLHDEEKRTRTSDDKASTIQQEQDSEPLPEPDHPPDGGLRAWLQVVAAHLVVFNSWGLIISFGIFQPYYETELDQAPSVISWIGSLQICLIFLIGTFSGRAFDAGYYRTALVIGLTLQLLGVFMTSLATEYWQILLSQGLCLGLGNGIIFAPTVANVSTYFTTKKTMAISCAACGGTTGGIVFPLVAQQLMPKIGFPWTIRVMGLLIMISSGVILILARPRLPGRKTGPLVDLAAFKEASYSLFAISMFFTLWATWIVYFYARTYVLVKLDAAASDSFTILLIINAVGLPGRIVPAYLADRYFGAINVFIPTIISAALCIYLWTQVQSMTGAYVWVVFFGYFGAGIQSLFPSSCAGLTKDLSKAGTRIGMIFTIVSIAALTGSPLAGKLVEVTDGGYLAMQIWGGSSMLLGTALLCVAKVMSDREKEVK